MGIEKGDVVTYEELREIYEKVIEEETKETSVMSNVDKDERLRGLMVVCKNCKHMDCVEGMRVAKERVNYTVGGIDDRPSRPKPYNPWKSKPWTPSYNKTKNVTYKMKNDRTGMGKLARGKMKNYSAYVSSAALWDENIKSFEDFLKCPKCGSRAVELSDDARKKITVEVI